MAHEISVTLRADPKPYEQATERLSKATDEWQRSTAAGADDVDARFADVIRALVDMERQAGRTGPDIEKSLRAIGLSSDDAADALKAVERELENVGDAGDDAKRAGDDVASISGKASGVGDSVRDLGQIASDVLKGDFKAAAEGAAGALGELGAAAGVGGAVGGLVVQAVQGLIAQISSYWDEWHAAVEGAKEDAFGLGEAITQVGYQAAIDQWTGSLEKFNEVRDIATISGQREVDVLDALASGGPKLTKLYDDFVNGANNTANGADIASSRIANLGGVLEGTKAGFAGQQAAQDLAAQATRVYGDEVEKATGKVGTLWDKMQNPPPSPEVTVKVRVDSSEYDRWQPQIKTGQVRVSGTTANGQRQLLP